MKKIIIARYAEVFLKGKNIAFFESKLKRNIEKALADFGVTVKIMRCRYQIGGYDEFDEPEIIERLKKVFGIHSISTCFVVPSTLENLQNAAKEMIDFEGTFKVETNRADKKFPLKSPEVSAKVGAFLLSNCRGLSVDVKNPQHIVNIDMRENGESYVFVKIIPCTGGLPSGCSSSGMLMLSGGIDSPVAGYMIGKRGMTLHGVYFHSYPYTGDLAKEKVIKLASILNSYTQNFKLHIVPFTKIQEAIHEKCAAELMITIMRRFMMRITERVMRMNRAACIITGESLGQVASQTIESMTVTNEVVTVPVLRPLIGMDKLEIIDIAQKIGTFETSSLPYEDCCTVFLPDHPIIKPTPRIAREAESALDVDALCEEAINSIETIEF